MTLRIVDSVVSIPPKSTMSALEMTSASVRRWAPVSRVSAPRSDESLVCSFVCSRSRMTGAIAS